MGPHTDAGWRGVCIPDSGDGIFFTKLVFNRRIGY